jgi:hypothetical protein
MWGVDHSSVWWLCFLQVVDSLYVCFMCASVYIHGGWRIVDAQSLCFVGKLTCLSSLMFALQDGLWSFVMDWFYGFCDGKKMLKAWTIRSKSLLELDTLGVLKKSWVFLLLSGVHKYWSLVWVGVFCPFVVGGKCLTIIFNFFS